MIYAYMQDERLTSNDDALIFVRFRLGFKRGSHLFSTG